MALTTKTIVAAQIAANFDITKKLANEIITDVYNIIATAVAAGEDVKIDNVGTIKQVTRAARTGHNPSTGAKLEIPAKKTLKFKPFANIKTALNS
jgi:nucleoid DNA-binding protein